MAKAGELRFVVTTDAKGAITDIRKITGNVDDLEKGTKKATDSWGKLGRRIAAAISIYAGARLFQNIGKAAIDAAETTSKFGVVFENEISKANDITKELVASYGFSVTGAEQALSSVGDLAQGLGIASDVSLQMAENTAKFATDLVSFTNVTGGTERAIDALTKAQLGEREMLKAYGIAIHEADVQQRLLLKGQNELEGSALKAAKAQAVLELAMEQSKNAAGNFALTMRDPANQLRILESRVEDFKVGLGKAIIEQTGFSDGVSAINDVLSDQNLQQGLASIISSITKLASILINATAGLIDFITQTSKLKIFEQAVEQTENLTAHMRRQEQAISNAGISIDRYHEILKQTPEFKEILELTDAIEKQKQKIEETNETYRSSIYDPVRAGIVAKEQGKLSELIRDQTELQVKANREIIKNAKAYGISEKEVNAYTKSLRGDLDATLKKIKADKEAEKQRKKVTKAIETQAEMIKRIGEELEKSHDKTVNLMEFEIELTEELEKQTEASMDLVEGLEGIEDGYDKNVDAAREVEEATKKYNEELKESIGLIFDVASQLLNFVGVSDQAIRGLEGLVGGFMQLTSGDILGGISSLVGGAFDLIGGLFGAKEKAEELGEEFANAKGIVDTIRGTGEFWESFGDSVKDLTEFLKIGAATQEEFNNQTQITLGHFAAMINSGASYIEVLQAMSEPLGLLQDSMDEFGFTADDTFTALIELQQKAAQNEELLTSIGAFNQLLIASRNLIGGNEDQFDAYANQTLLNYEKLLEANFSQQEALLLTAPALQQLQELQKQYGFTVDENTQKLIDEADSLGLFKTDPLDRIVEVLELIAIQLGAVIPEAAETAAERTEKAFNDLASSAIRDFENMASAAGQIIVPIDTRQTGTRTQPPLLPLSNTPGFANGGGGIVPPGFNNDDFFFRASSGEEVRVAPRGQAGGAAQDNFNLEANFYNTFSQPISPGEVSRRLLEDLRRGLLKDELKRELA